MGHMLRAQLEGDNAPEILKREDWFINATAGAYRYFTPYNRWPVVERRSMRFVRGRVLDVV